MNAPLVAPLNATTDLPNNVLVAVVTSLEMVNPPKAPLAAYPEASHPNIRLEQLGAQDVGRYLAMFKALGERWMWFSRLMMPPEDVAAIIGHQQVRAYCLVLVSSDGKSRDIGLLELDARAGSNRELAFLGVLEEALGKGFGRWLMSRALEIAWSSETFDMPCTRLWVHTCTFDHPNALAFYQRSGFQVFKRGIELVEDPRLTGVLSVDAAPHVPLLKANAQVDRCFVENPH